jgi:outer membrane protein assembly factor BamB
MTRSLPLLSAALAALCVIPTAGLAQSAPAMFRGGPEHRGVTDTRGLERLGGLAWRFETAGPVRSSPVVADGVVYFGSADGHLYAVDAATGAQRWRYEAGAPVGGAPLVTETLVVFVDRANRIHGLRRESGDRRWLVEGGPDLPLAWGWEGWDYLLASPTLAGGVVLAGTGDGFLNAIELERGEVRWRFRTGGRIRSAPAVHDGVVYVAAGDGVVYGLTLAAGVEVWRFETRGAGLRAVDFGYDRTQIYSSPAVVDGVLYIGSRDASLYAVDLATGEARWTFEDGSAWVIASPAVHGATVYSARSSSGRVRALDAQSGEERWAVETGGLVFSSPVLVDGTVYVGSGDGRIYAFDAATGEQRWLYHTDGAVVSTPAVWEGMLYVGSDDGYLYALQRTLGPQPRLAVYWDDSLMSRAVWGRSEDHRQPADYFRDVGYEPLDSTGLRAFLAERVDDAVPSVPLSA